MRSFSVTAVFFALFAVWILAQDASVGLGGEGAAASTMAQVPPAPRLGEIEIPLTVKGNQFTLRFPPEQVAAKDMATRLCTEQAAALGVTEETLGVCVEKITAYAQAAVDNWVAVRSMRIPVVVNGTQFQVTMFPEVDDIAATASNICEATELGKTEEGRPQCLGAVSDYLRRAIADWADEKTLRTAVTIEQNTFEVEFMPERQSPQEMAAKLCASYMEQLSLTPESVAACSNPVADFLVSRVDSWVASKTLTTTVTINTQEYTVSFYPEREGAAAVARNICLQKAEELQLTQENFQAQCGTPLTDYLGQQVDQWVESKRVVVPMKMGEEEVSAVIFPERQSTVSVAQQLCVSRASALGLTNENIGADCIRPVNQLLSEAVQKWAASRSA